VGGYGRSHVKSVEILEKEGLGEISAVVIRNREKYEKEAARLEDRGVVIYDDYDKMLEGETGRAEIVTLPTPIHQHKDMTIKALENGFNVIVEKPPAATIQDLNEMIEAERKSGKFCAVGFQWQSKNTVRELKKYICEGKLGEIKEVLVKGKWKRLDSYYERTAWAGKFIYDGQYVLDGTINNPLAHYLMNALYFATRERQKAASPLRVRAELYRGHKIEGEDTSCLMTEVDSGAQIFFFATLCSPNETKPVHRVIGTRGVAEWTAGSDVHIKYSDGQVEVIKDDGRDEKVEVFRNAARYLRRIDKEIYCPLKMTKPFVLTVNAAYESAKLIKQIPDQFLIREEEGESVSTTIKNIDETIDRAFESRKLYSDLGVEWAYKTGFFSVKGYDYFDLKLKCN
jgi:predicted dehydrogenase